MQDVPGAINGLLDSLPAKVSVQGLPFDAVFTYAVYTLNYVIVKVRTCLLQSRDSSCIICLVYEVVLKPEMVHRGGRSESGVCVEPMFPQLQQLDAPYMQLLCCSTHSFTAACSVLH
jgi:hypothetical protein